MGKILDIKGMEVLDSRGNPTVMAEVTLDSGVVGKAIVPSGASTGSREALELRDGGTRYMGMGVLKAVSNVNGIIRESLIGLESGRQEDIDNIMIMLDGTDNKSNLGANAILAVSMAYLKASAKDAGKELYEYLGDKTLPIAMMNILNGGVHADNDLGFQEFMIIPMSSLMKERVRIGSEVFHALKKVLKSKGYNTNVGDEGGFAPAISSDDEALSLVVEAIKLAGYIPGRDVNIAIDAAASEFYKSGKYYIEDNALSTEELINYYEELTEKYPIVSIEDPVDENDWDGFKLITERLGDKIQLVGDDLFVTNTKYLEKGIKMHAGNAILVKVNQIGTITETINTINLAKKSGYSTIISHRSGETEDTIIADLAVGLNTGQIKTGSMSRTDRTAKYNRLMRIEESLYEK